MNKKGKNNYDGTVGLLSENEAFFIEDNWGDVEEFNNPYSKEIESIYLQGQCLAYAVEMSKKHNYPIVILYSEEESEEWDEENDQPFMFKNIYHAFVKDNVGNFLDIRGKFTSDEILSEDEYFDGVMEFSGPYEAKYNFEGYMSDQNYYAAQWVIESREAHPELVEKD